MLYEYKLMNDYAKLAQAAYNDDLIRVDGYVRNNALSRNGVSVYTKGNTSVISHRGTQSFEDVKPDLALLFGEQRKNKTFSSRAQQTQKIIDALPLNQKVVLVGHSLGGNTALNALEFPKIHSRVQETHLFNLGTVPLRTIHVPKNAKDVFIHRVEGDAISSNTVQGGEHVQYDAPKRHFLVEALESVSTSPILSLLNGIGRVRNAHTIERFIN